MERERHLFFDINAKSSQAINRVKIVEEEELVWTYIADGEINSHEQMKILRICIDNDWESILMKLEHRVKISESISCKLKHYEVP